LREAGILQGKSLDCTIKENCTEVNQGGAVGKAEWIGGQTFVLRPYRTAWSDRLSLAVEIHDDEECLGYPICCAYLQPNSGMSENGRPGLELQHICCSPAHRGKGQGRAMWRFLLNRLSPLTVAYGSAKTGQAQSFLHTMITETRRRDRDCLQQFGGVVEGVYISQQPTAASA
jgi:hypothetical protein